MVNLLKSWLKWLPVKVEDSKYKHLLDYIGHLQKQEKSTHHINRSLQTISHYYQFKHLKQEAKTKLNIDIQKLNHLRQSRVSIWVKEQGLRKGQYLAGFRRVLSAE